MGNIRALFIVLVCIGLLGVLGYLLLKADSPAQFQSLNDPNLSETEKRFAKNQRDQEARIEKEIVDRHFNEFLVSSAKSAPDVGDKFPHKNITDEVYQQLNFSNKLSVIVIGQGTVDAPEKIAGQFSSDVATKKIQFIRIITSGKMPANSQSTVIDARDENNKINSSTSSGKTAKWLGLASSPAAYLVDSTGKVLYSKLSGGYSVSTELPFYIQQALLGKTVLLKAKTLKPNSSLDLTLFGEKISQVLEKYIHSKSGTSVFIFTLRGCDVCSGLEGSLESGIAKWKKEGHGIILIESDPAKPEGFLEKDQVLHIYDEDKSILKAMNIEKYPQVLFFQDAKYFGAMSYTGMSKVTGVEITGSGDSAKRRVTEEQSNLPWMKAIDKAVNNIR